MVQLPGLGQGYLTHPAGPHGSSQQVPISLTGFLSHICAHLHTTSCWYSKTLPTGTHVMPTVEPTVRDVGTARSFRDKEDRPAKHTLAGKTAMYTGSSHRDILEDALTSTLAVLPALFVLSYVVTGHLELVEKGPVQNRAVSPAVPRHTAREFYPITWPRALYCKHCLHLQCGAFYYIYWAWFPPRVTKSEAVLPQLRFQPQKIQREQESGAKKRGWTGGGRTGVELRVQTPGRQGI